MPWFDVFWNHVDPDGNVAHVAQHGLTPEDVDHVLMNPVRDDTSDASGRPVRYGFTPDGRYVCVVYEMIDDVTLYPVTAYEVE